MKRYTVQFDATRYIIVAGCESEAMMMCQEHDGNFKKVDGVWKYGWSFDFEEVVSIHEEEIGKGIISFVSM